MKNILFTLCAVLSLVACGEKQENKAQTSQEQTNNASVSYENVSITDTIFNYQKDQLSDSCTSDSEIVCSIENVIKCALNNTQNFCDKNSMPEFIFYDDAMFADDNGLGRPTQQSFKMTKIKPIDNNTIEVFTVGTCDKNWFGLCNGNIIYVLNNQTGKWQVKEVYALEKI